MKLRVLFFLLALSGLALLTVGCGKSPSSSSSTSGKAKIIFWHSYVKGTWPALNRLIARFEKEHPNIDISQQFVPTGDQLLQKLTTSIATNTAPDICWIHSSWVAPLSKGDYVYDLDELARQYGGFGEAEKQDFFPAPLRTSYYRGKLRMMPVEGTNVALAYNRDMFRRAGLDPTKPPKTWPELGEMGRKLVVSKEGRVDQWGFAIPVYTGQLYGHTVWLWNPFLWGWGGQYADPSGQRVTFNSDAGVAALQYWVDLQHKYHAGKMNTPDQGFESQKVAMALMGPWDLPHLADMTFDWAMAPMPTGPKKHVTAMGAEYMVIFRQTQHPKEAWEFISWFISPEVQEQWSMDSKYLPIRQSVLKSPSYRAFLDKEPNLKVFADQMPIAYGESNVLPDVSELDLILGTGIEKAVRGAATPRQALDEAAQKANIALAKAWAAERSQPAAGR